MKITKKSSRELHKMCGLKHKKPKLKEFGVKIHKHWTSDTCDKISFVIKAVDIVQAYKDAESYWQRLKWTGTPRIEVDEL